MRGRGVLSLVLLLASCLALDDITTDNANAFPLEYGILIAAGIWYLALGVWLLARQRVCAGRLSLAAVAIGMVAFWSLPHHYQTPSFINNLGCVPLAWFMGLSIWLLVARVQPPADKPA